MPRLILNTNIPNKNLKFKTPTLKLDLETRMLGITAGRTWKDVRPISTGEANYGTLVSAKYPLPPEFKEKLDPRSPSEVEFIERWPKMLCLILSVFQDFDAYPVPITGTGDPGFDLLGVDYSRLENNGIDRHVSHLPLNPSHKDWENSHLYELLYADCVAHREAAARDREEREVRRKTILELTPEQRRILKL